MKKILASVLATATTTTALVAAPLVASPAQADPPSVRISIWKTKRIQNTNKVRVYVDIESVSTLVEDPETFETSFTGANRVVVTGPGGATKAKNLNPTHEFNGFYPSFDIPNTQKPNAKLAFTVRATNTETGLDLSRSASITMPKAPKPKKAVFYPKYRWKDCSGKIRIAAASLYIRESRSMVKVPGSKSFKRASTRGVAAKRAGTYHYKTQYEHKKYPGLLTTYSKTTKTKVTKKMLKKVRGLRSVTTRACY